MVRRDSERQDDCEK